MTWPPLYHWCCCESSDVLRLLTLFSSQYSRFMILLYKTSSIGFIPGTTTHASAMFEVLQVIISAQSELFVHRTIAWASGEDMGAWYNGTKSAGEKKQMARRAVFRQFLTNLDQPMPLSEKVRKLTGNLWRRVALRQTCCGHPGEPGC